MTERLEQRYCIKFCQKLWDTQAETIHNIQQAFGDDAMGVTQIKEWFNCFEDGRMSADSDQLSGRPSTSRNAYNNTDSDVFPIRSDSRLCKKT
jgi:hypothetical protein